MATRLDVVVRDRAPLRDDGAHHALAHFHRARLPERREPDPLVRDERQVVRKLNWRFPSRSECTLCHTMAAKYVLGVTTLQMNKDHDYGGVIANQLATLDHLGVFKEKLPKPPEELPRLADYQDETPGPAPAGAGLPARQLCPLPSQVGRRQRRVRAARLRAAHRT